MLSAQKAGWSVTATAVISRNFPGLRCVIYVAAQPCPERRERMRSFRFPAAVISLLFMSLAQAQTTHSPLEKDFVAGGTVKMDLESGQYDIRAGSDNRIHIRWNEADRGVRVKLDTSGTSADLRVENTPHDHFRATIEVPASTNLNIYFTAGDLRIDGIKGDKKVDMNAGDLN